MHTHAHWLLGPRVLVFWGVRGERPVSGLEEAASFHLSPKHPSPRFAGGKPAKPATPALWGQTPKLRQDKQTMAPGDKRKVSKQMDI